MARTSDRTTCAQRFSFVLGITYAFHARFELVGLHPRATYGYVAWAFTDTRDVTSKLEGVNVHVASAPGPSLCAPPLSPELIFLVNRQATSPSIRSCGHVAGASTARARHFRITPARA